MTWQRLTAVIVALGAIAGAPAACSDLSNKWDVEIHVSRVWGVDEALPERLR